MTDENANPEATGSSSGPAIDALALEDFGAATATAVASPDNLGRVMDVCVPMTARIGIVRKSISEVLDLVPGSIVDLERNAGEPIDLVIGDKLIARGEIVVVDDRYGVRIVQVVQED
ncbi:MAG: FliM/FliN family flagellar motor switch protein [Planctomycetes bacterium]|nr:FliM/FliN family flagellar motor switch protein [Planctomycetota bacterium]